MYDRFSIIYDRVMRGVNYPAWADYVLNLASKYSFDASNTCEMACGTGTLALLLAEKGCKVHGLDRSAAMLAEARRKAAESQLPGLRWTEADITKFDLNETFSLVTCLYDSVNYLLDEKDVLSCLKQAYKHTEPGGGFIFDITTEYNIVLNFADYTFAENFNDFSYIWENHYNIETKIIKSKVTIFEQDGDKYTRHLEVHKQKLYPESLIAKLIQKAGFKLVSSFDGFTLDSPGSKVERIHFVCRKEK